MYILHFNNLFFMTMESILTHIKGGATAMVFTNSEEGTVWNKLYKNHMTEESFIGGREAIEIVTERNDLLTDYTDLGMIRYHSEPCVLNVLWKSGNTDQSMAFPIGKAANKNFTDKPLMIFYISSDHEELCSS